MKIIRNNILYQQMVSIVSKEIDISHIGFKINEFESISLL